MPGSPIHSPSDPSRGSTLARLRPPKNPLATFLALSATAAVIAIVCLANQGLAARYFGFLYSFPGGDKVGHLTIMATLTFLVTTAFRRTVSLGSVRLPVASLLILALVTAEELSQGHIPGRSLDLTDWLANLTGVLTGAALAARLSRPNPGSHT